MNRDEFLSLVEEVDRNLRLRGVPVHARPLHAFREMAGDYEGPILGYGVDPNAYPEYVGPNLLRKINDWYVARYGDRINLPTTLGRIPFVLRDEIFTARIPLMYGGPRVNPVNLIDGMTSDMELSLTGEETQAYVAAWVVGCELVYEMEDLLGRGDLSQYSPPARELITRAIEDRDAAVESLRGPCPQTNVSCFHSQQHAEKMLKAVLVHVESLTEQRVKEFGHRIGDLADYCRARIPAFAEVANDAARLSGVLMDIRYAVPSVPKIMAADTYFAALRIGGLCASRLSGKARRLGTARVDSTGLVVVRGVLLRS